MSVLGLDLGTSTCKGVVLSSDGKLLAQKQIAYADAVCVRDMAATIPAECFWTYTAQVIRALAAETKNDPIEALAVSSHGETLIPVDHAGDAVCDAILSMDRRCAAQSEQLVRRLGQEKIYGLTGSLMHPQFPVPKVMWLQEDAPALAGKAVQHDSACDYIYRKLGFPHVMDYSIASRFGGFDVRKRVWAQEILDAAGIDGSVFSEAVCGGTPLGYIPRSIAVPLGLKDCVLAVAGGHDQPCAAIGMGVVKPGTVTVSAGSYECAVIATDEPLNNSKGMRYGLNSYCHVLPNQAVTLAFFVSGMMAKWYLDTFCQAEKQLAAACGSNVFEQMECGIQQEPTGICVTPHIFGAMNPEWSEHATAKVIGLTAAATKTDMYQAVLEGACCELDLNLRVLEKLTNPVQRLLMTGGGTKSPAWMQMRAEITGKPIDVVENGAEASCIGAAILAGVGARLFADPWEANCRIKREIKTYLPQHPQAYKAQKETYLTLHRPDLLD